MPNIPHFALCERTGKYQARRALTEDQIIRAARSLLDRRVCQGASLTHAEIVKRYLILHFAKHQREHFVCLFADNRHRLLKTETLFTGTIDRAEIHPREVVRRCLELNAAAVIFAHNHPSGHAKPSPADRAITARLTDALHLINVRVLDHILVGGGGAYSFAQQGLL